MGIFLERHDRAANDVRRAEIAAHRVQSDFHRSGILRRSARECKSKKRCRVERLKRYRVFPLQPLNALTLQRVTPRRSGPGGPCNSRRKGRRYATRRCCRTGCTCSIAAPASDATPCGCAVASSKFCVWELPWGRQESRDLGKDKEG